MIVPAQLDHPNLGDGVPSGGHETDSVAIPGAGPKEEVIGFIPWNSQYPQAGNHVPVTGTHSGLQVMVTTSVVTSLPGVAFTFSVLMDAPEFVDHSDPRPSCENSNAPTPVNPFADSFGYRVSRTNASSPALSFENPVAVALKYVVP
jgi:hypothetical protein